MPPTGKERTLSGFLNLSSLFLGLIAWIVPLAAIAWVKKGKRFSFFAIGSFTACSLALVLQLQEVKHRVDLGDTAAIMDTIGAIAFVSVVLVVVTVIINLAVAAACRPPRS